MDLNQNTRVLASGGMNKRKNMNRHLCQRGFEQRNRRVRVGRVLGKRLQYNVAAVSARPPLLVDELGRVEQAASVL